MTSFVLISFAFFLLILMGIAAIQLFRISFIVEYRNDIMTFNRGLYNSLPTIEIMLNDWSCWNKSDFERKYF